MSEGTAVVILLVTSKVACASSSDGVVAGADHVPSPASERRFPRTESVARMAGRLETITGVPPASQVLRFYAAGAPCSAGQACLVIENPGSDGRMLHELPVSSYMSLEVTDLRSRAEIAASNAAGLCSTTSAAKYVMSEADYEMRKDSVRAFKKNYKLGRFADSADAAQQARQAALDAHISKLNVGARCAVDGVYGTVRYIGLHPDHLDDSEENEGKAKTAGTWVGVEYDEPRGKNDGTVAGVRLFTANPNHGMLVRPLKVELGDFPVTNALTDLGVNDLELEL